MLENGRLLPTDHYYDARTSQWILLSSLIAEESTPSRKPTPPPEESPSSDGTGKSASSGSRRSGRGKSRKQTAPALGGWITCLFAIGAAAGLWAWSQSLSNGLESANEKLREQTLVIDHLQGQIDQLTELTPPGRVRAIITYEPAPEKTAVVSGATVELHHRSTVEKAMAAANIDNSSSATELNASMKRVQEALTSPLEITVTKSNGRIDMAVPEPGAYVLLASAAKSSPTGQIQLIWLIGFEATNQPSSLILMNESNAISRKNPDLVVTEIQSNLAIPNLPPPSAETP